MRRTAAVVGSLFVIPVLAAAPAGARAGFEWSGTCTGASVVVTVAREDLDAYVPEGFAIAGEQTGHVPFALQMFDCTDAVIDGTPVGRLVVSEALVVLDRERSPALAGQPPSDIEFYVIPTPSTSTHLRLALSTIGLEHEVDQEMTFALTETGAIAKATGSAPRDFSVGASAARAFPDTDWGVCCTWQLGSEGLVRTSFALTDQTFDAGAGYLNAVPGSPIYEILGEQSRKDGAGAVRDFSFIGTVELRADGDATDDARASFDRDARRAQAALPLTGVVPASRGWILLAAACALVLWFSTRDPRRSPGPSARREERR